jgi:hypothetical protein
VAVIQALAQLLLRGHVCHGAQRRAGTCQVFFGNRPMAAAAVEETIAGCCLAERILR